MDERDPAEQIFEFLAAEYVKAGYPNHKVWNFSPGDEEDTAFAKLRAHGFIEQMGARGSAWRLTNKGQRQVLAWESARAARPQSVSIVTSSTATAKSMMRVFISHSSADRETAAAFVALLRAALPLSARDIRCTSVDGHKLSPGVEFEQQLRQEVFAADTFIALVSPSSFASVYVMFELGARWASAKYLVPLMVAGFEANMLQPPLSSINAVVGTSEADLHELVQTLAQELGLVPESPSAYLGALQSFLALASKKSKANVSRHDVVVDEQRVTAYRDVLGAIAMLRSAINQLNESYDWNTEPTQAEFAPTNAALKTAYGVIEHKRDDTGPAFAQAAKAVVNYYDREADLLWDRAYNGTIAPPSFEDRETAMYEAIATEYRTRVAPGWFAGAPSK